jgi:hypothetical protein
MRSIAVVIFLLFINSICYSQFNPLEGMVRTKTNRGLKEKKTVVLEDTSGKAPFVSSIILYNEDGSHYRSYSINANGDTTQRINSFYPDANTELTVYIENDGVDSLFEFYDPQNRLIKSIWLWSDDNIPDINLNFYDKNGWLIREEEKYWRSRNLYTYKNKRLISIRTIEDGNKEEEEDPENYISAKFEYSNDDLTFTKTGYNYNNKPYNIIIRTNNNKGLPIKEEDFLYNSGTKTLRMLHTWEYNENGIITTSTAAWYENGKEKWSFLYKYNEKGDLINTLHEDMVFKYKILEEYRYEYY